MEQTNRRINEKIFTNNIQKYLDRFRKADPDDSTPALTNEQLHIIEEIQYNTTPATPPLQRLHPVVTFIVIPIFAISDAGVTLNIDFEHLFSNNVALGVALGLLVGKVVSVVGFTLLMVKLKIAQFPKGMTFHNLFGHGLLASIGFTMSLFITSLAFTHHELITQAKIGIFVASIVGGVLGFWVLKYQGKKADSIDQKSKNI